MGGNFKFQLQDSFFWDLEVWKTNRTFWKKATFSLLENWIAIRTDDLRLDAPKTRKIQISHFLRFVSQKFFRKTANKIKKLKHQTFLSLLLLKSEHFSYYLLNLMPS